ncbi:MAG: LPS assembly lipoprotein LptE [Pseudomonadota bacterium]
MKAKQANLARRGFLGGLAALAGVSILGGCGFQLRGKSQLPFTAAYVTAGAGSVLAGPLRQALSSQDKLATAADAAPVRISLVDETRSKTILSLSGGGKVKEYRLAYKVRLVVTDPQGKELIAPSEILLNRDFSYSDAEVLAKEGEENALNKAMEQEALRQVLRRLSYVQR